MERLHHAHSLSCHMREILGLILILPSIFFNLSILLSARVWSSHGVVLVRELISVYSLRSNAHPAFLDGRAVLHGFYLLVWQI